MKIAKLLVNNKSSDRNYNKQLCYDILPIKFNDKGDVSMEIIRCSMINENSGHSMIKIIDINGTHSHELRNMSHACINGEYSISKVGVNQYIAEVINNECPISRIIAESKLFLMSTKSISNNLIEWTLIGLNSTYIRNFIKIIKDLGYLIIRRQITDLDTEMKLTAKQEQIMRYAIDNGYYEIPKKITIDDLCKKFECSKSTLSVITRTAEKKILKMYLDSGLLPTVNKT